MKKNTTYTLGGTYAECKKTINGVCARCGGKLSPIKTSDNASRPTYWVGCKKCNLFTNNTDADIYKIAKYLVNEESWAPFTEFSRMEYENNNIIDYWIKCQIHGSTRLVKDVLNAIKTLKIEDKIIKLLL